MKMNDEAIKSPLMGFTFDTDPVKNEISNVATIIKEYHVIAVGAEDPEKYYDEMIERLKGAGIDKIVTEVKNQYDKWQKNKLKEEEKWQKHIKQIILTLWENLRRAIL